MAAQHRGRVIDHVEGVPAAHVAVKVDDHAAPPRMRSRLPAVKAASGVVVNGQMVQIKEHRPHGVARIIGPVEEALYAKFADQSLDAAQILKAA